LSAAGQQGHDDDADDDADDDHDDNYWDAPTGQPPFAYRARRGVGFNDAVASRTPRPRWHPASWGWLTSCKRRVHLAYVCFPDTKCGVAWSRFVDLCFEIQGRRWFDILNMVIIIMNAVVLALTWWDISP
jgi:hypothetical protein